MADSILYPSAIDMVRVINDNLIDNALGKRNSFVLMPSLYQRAYMLCHETGALPVITDILAPDEKATSARAQTVNITTGTG